MDSWKPGNSNVWSGHFLSKNGNYNRSLSCICVFLPDGIVLGFQIFPGGSGGCEMIHDHLRHFLSEEVVREAWVGLGIGLGFGACVPT